jgi:choline dehydrogenase
MSKVAATDYVIVGAGSAGCLLANRLSANPDTRVTLLEAGGWDNSIFVTMPAGFLHLMQSGGKDWGYSTVPQQRLGGRRIHSPRGKIIGGSSSVNGQVYVRGDPSDFDHWAQLGNRGWSFTDCLPFFKKSEGFEGEGGPARGREGPLRTTRRGIRHPLASAFAQACQQWGLTYNDDFNSGADQGGVGPTDSTTADNKRCSSAVAFLRPALSRKNLAVVTRALASRVIVERGRAVGVEYLKGGAREVVRAEREVVLAGGAVNSPQLLQLSGIGDGDHLRRIGLNVIHELKGVGRNLQDHPGVGGVKQRCTQPISSVSAVRFHAKALALAQYALFKTGPAANNGLEAMAFVRTRPDIVAPDLQYFMTMLMYENSGRRIIPEHGFMVVFTLQRPESRGAIMIRSADPRVAPDIDPNYFDQEIDLRTMREGVKIGREIFAQRAFDPYRGDEYAPGRDVVTDPQIDEFLRRTVDSNYHLSGTCKMGVDDLAVVDPDLRVRGIDGLRVVDASIMPTVVSGNTNAATIMIAEKGADYIIGH